MTADGLHPNAGQAPLEDPVLAALRWRDQGRPAALATVLRTWGSSPRRAGSRLAVNEACEFVGSVSGGCVEGAVIEAALEVMAGRAPHTLEFGVTDEEAWAVGLACGGSVAVRVERVEGALEEALHELAGLKEGRRAAVLATPLEGGAHQVLYPKMGDGGSDSSLTEAARLALRLDRSSVVETAEGPVFLGAFNPPARLVVVGAVHIAQALAPMAALAGLDVTVLDPRSAFATDARFPDVHLVRAWPEEALPGFGLDARTAVVTLSHDPKLDDPALTAALRSEAFYVGALGSRRTHQRRVARLTDLGFTETDISRIHAPVGLDIGAVSPAEIAVATLAQVVARLRSEDRPAA